MDLAACQHIHMSHYNCVTVCITKRSLRIAVMCMYMYVLCYCLQTLWAHRPKSFHEICILFHVTVSLCQTNMNWLIRFIYKHVCYLV